jgi:hypothetical protein
MRPAKRPVLGFLPALVRTTGLAAVISIAGLASGCKQDEGDRCEVDNDCKSGLQCDSRVGQCENPQARPDAATTQTDAAPVGIDGAPPSDARPGDGGVDAPSGVDAPAPTPDAAGSADAAPDA